MVRHFLTNLSFVFALNILVKPLYIFGIEVQVQNTVGATVYGVYFALLNAVYLIQIMNDFGLQIYNNRRVANDSSALVTVFPSLLRTKLLMGVLFFGAVALIGVVLGYQDQMALLAVIGINLFLTSMVLFIRSAISGLGHYKYDSLLSVGDKLLMIVLCGALLLTFQDSFTIMYFALAQTASLLIVAVVASLVLYAKRPRRSPGITQKETASTLMRKALPFALAVFLMTAYTRVDAVMLEQMASNGEYQAGLYAAGYRLLDACNMVAYLFAALLLPMFGRLIKDQSASIALISKAAKLMWIITVLVAVSSFVFQDEIMQLLYTEATQVWASVFGTLILSFVPIGFMYIFGTFMTAQSTMRSLNIAYFTCIVLNVVLNSILIPQIGASGAAIATLATQGVVSCWLMFLALKKLEMKIPVSKILQAVLFALIFCICAFGIHWVTPAVGKVLFILPALGIGVFIAWVTGLLNVNDIRGLLGRDYTE